MEENLVGLDLKSEHSGECQLVELVFCGYLEEKSEIYVDVTTLDGPNIPT